MFIKIVLNKLKVLFTKSLSKYIVHSVAALPYNTIFVPNYALFWYHVQPWSTKKERYRRGSFFVDT